MTAIRSALSAARRAFSLIELAVVLIVIGIIAAIAIPTFQAVIERSEIRAAVTTQQAVARDVTAILAFQDGTSPEQALTEALGETGTASAPGVEAAGTFTRVGPESTSSTSNLGSKSTVSWAVDDDYLGWAMLIESGKGVKCRIELATGGGECWSSASAPSGFTALAGPDDDVTLDDDGGGVVTIPTTTTPTLNAPATPTGVSVAASDTSVVISWDAVTGTSQAPVTGYRVFKDGAFLDVTSSTSLVAATLTNGTSYSFEVAAYGGGGISARSAVVTATPVAPPAQVTGVVATPGAGLVSLSWTAVESSAAAPVTGYRVFRGATQVLETPALGSIVTGLDDATSYSFTVRAYGPGGAGAASDAAVVSTFGGPAQVTGVTGAPGAKLVVLSWTAVDATPTAPVTGYRVFRGGTQILETPSVGAIVTGLDDDTSYSFTVVAYGPGGVGAASDQVTVTTFGAPAKVTGVSATPTGTFITVTWTASAVSPTAPVTGYRVLKNGVQIADTPGTSTLVTGLAAGTSYSFTVVAYGPGGAADASNSVSATTLAPPAKVTGVAAAPIGTTIVSLTWNAVTSTAGAPVTGYRVYQNGNQVAETPGTSTLITSLSPGTSYIFTVAAYGPAGEGAESSSVSATTPVPTTTTTTTIPPTTTTTIPAPASPTGLSSAAGNLTVQLSWSATPGATSYKVYRTNNSTFALTNAVTVIAPTTSATYSSGLTNGTPYYLWVVAVNATGSSAPAGPVSATPFTKPGAPTAVTVTTSDTTAFVAFTAPASNGSPITSYTANCTGGTAASGSGSASPITVTGLSVAAYTCRVTATNAAGTGTASSASASFNVTNTLLSSSAYNASAPSGGTNDPAFNGLLNLAVAQGAPLPTMNSNSPIQTGNQASIWDNNTAGGGTYDTTYSPAYVDQTVDFGTRRVSITDVKVYATVAQNWTGSVWGSVDGTTWTQLGSNLTYTAGTSVRHHTSASATKYRYVQLRVTPESGSDQITIRELELFGNLYSG